MDRPESAKDVVMGEVIGGYRLERLLGAGSTSKVYLGHHALLNRTAAIKVLEPTLVGNESVVARLLNEARIVNDVRHPNIIEIMDFIVSSAPARVALVMELIEGPSLKALRGDPIAPRQAIGVALQLVDAVEAAHAAGVIHRDLKPDNLLLMSDPRLDPAIVPRLKVVDFGIAKLAGSGGKTATGMMLGTPAYMAPEQIAGRPSPSPATDVFAIGEVLFELLTGRRLYPTAAIPEIVRTKLRGDVPPIELPAMPGDTMLRVLIQGCLALRPNERPSLREVRRILLELPTTSERAVAQSHGATPLPSPAERVTVRWPTPPPRVPAASTARERTRTPARSSIALPLDIPTQDVGALRRAAAAPPGIDEAAESVELEPLPGAATDPRAPHDPMPAGFDTIEDAPPQLASRGEGRVTATHLSRTLIPPPAAETELLPTQRMLAGLMGLDPRILPSPPTQATQHLRPGIAAPSVESPMTEYGLEALDAKTAPFASVASRGRAAGMGRPSERTTERGPDKRREIKLSEVRPDLRGDHRASELRAGARPFGELTPPVGPARHFSPLPAPSVSAAAHRRRVLGAGIVALWIVATGLLILSLILRS